MNFSVILASRDRVSLLDGLLKSISQTVENPDNCEVIVVVDDDDRITRYFMDKIPYKFARGVVRPRARNLNNDYLNWAWQNFSVGENIIVCNDDVVFRTPKWDNIIMSGLKEYLKDKPDGIAYGWIEDGLNNRQTGTPYCCFPLITRKAAEAVGFVMPPEFPGWGADIGVYRIYEAINRVCRLDVCLEHLSYHNGNRIRDGINHEVAAISHGSPHPTLGFQIGEYVERLEKRIQ